MSSKTNRLVASIALLLLSAPVGAPEMLLREAVQDRKERAASFETQAEEYLGSR
jgi:hypothetical protein